jgi:hypothetical protein
MQYPGYIVVAINYMNGDRATFKLGTKVIGPGDPFMIDRVFRTDSDTIQFFGSPMTDDEECWFRVPSTGYTSVSWKWFSAEELAEQKGKQ